MEAKRELRRRLLAARRALPAEEVDAAGEAIAHHVLDLPEVRCATRVAAYVSVGSEPGTGPVRAALRERGVSVLLPVLLPDDDLSWAEDDGELAPAARGLLEPTGPRLGVEVIAGVDLVLLPGLAVGRDGTRLGRGGGSYDRALARVPEGVPLVVLLHRGEVLDDVPAESHDRPVRAAVTPDGVLRL